MIPIVSVVGWHNSGKTAFVERLIVELKRRGLTVATIKHSRGDFEIDREGTDTWRFAQAGSDVVGISAEGRFALIERRNREMALSDIVRRLPPGVDLVITEGYKKASTLKIEVVRAELGGERITRPDELLALVSDDEVPWAKGLTRFASADASGVADLLAEHGMLRGEHDQDD